MIRTFILIATISFSFSVFAQNSINGRLLDEENKTLPFGTIALLNPADSTMKYFGITNKAGVYKITNIKKGDYILQFSFVGKKTIFENITISSKKEENFGDKQMKASLMNEVVVAAEYIPIQFKSDTVEFNTKAFETKPHAVVEDLLKKIPGIEVDESGNLKAMGEDVTKVLVDGKEFFGKDPKVATKNLPAKAIDKVQVFDKKSEEAQFMGIDDGVRDRTINLLLNEDNKKGYFGNLKAGYATDNYYKADGNVYRFSEKLQTALLGMYNNINDFGYTATGRGGWGQQVNGLNTTAAGGLNLSFNSTKYNRYFMSYLASQTKTELEQTSNTENFLQEGSYFQDSEKNEDETDTPQKINFGVRHNFNKQNNFTIDGDINISSNKLFSERFTNTLINDTSQNSLDNQTNSNSEISNASARAVYISKLHGDTTQIKTNIVLSYNKSFSGLDWNNATTIFDPYSLIINDQYQDNNTEKFAISANPTLVQRIKHFWYLSANADFGSTTENFDRKHGNSQDVSFTDSLSGDFFTERNYVRPAISLRRNSANQQINFILGAGWETFNKGQKNVFDIIPENLSENYFFFLPGFSYENNLQKGKRFKIRYNSGVNMPGTTQLLPIENTINPLSIYKGNIDLEPEYYHNVSAHLSIFDQFSFTSLFMRLRGEYTKDKISVSQNIDENFAQIVVPVNVPDHYSLSSFIYYSTPIRALGIKIKIRSYESWNKSINIINNEENINNSFTHTLKLSLENRIKEKWDARIGGSLSLTDSKFSLADHLNNIYYSTSYYTDIRFTPSKKWSFETEAKVANYNSKSFKESVSIPFLSASISYFFLPGEKASFSLRGYDLLDKSENIKQITATNYLMQQTSNTIGRYIMLSFSMKIGQL
ncbi:MAG: outer membrane beta-barrel protein [Bacteroidetes bacterium]|jgi:hypothetical protein|nr:outer membrane beta-barrel protein [Bacteroidota bacterium]MBT6685602.1 outer membrane beta-barrel protein [Bacteroidota bacterium]MBT7143603.1 outer membrane beta-barrel protein [Bacteroidota bacterium]MBT7490509.1 outer membrane beta-barrel protein [Bacteroidota bacterium]